MKGYIVVIGGYGHVGQTICRELGELYPGKVYAAGRSLERAEQFTRTTDERVRPLQINIKEGFDPNLRPKLLLLWRILYTALSCRMAYIILNSCLNWTVFCVLLFRRSPSKPESMVKYFPYHK